MKSVIAEREIGGWDKLKLFFSPQFLKSSLNYTYMPTSFAMGLCKITHWSGKWVSSHPTDIGWDYVLGLSQ